MRIASALVSARLPWIALWTVLIAVVAILYLLPETKPPGVYELDKGAHLIAFSAIGFPAWFIARRRGLFVLLVAADLTLGILLEILQSGVPGRDFSLFDILANIVGILLGATLGAYTEQIFARWLLMTASGSAAASTPAIRAD